MKIGIIGAGRIGGTLARRFTEIGHSVEIANSRGPQTLGEIAAQTGARPVTIEAAVADKDLIVVTIPELAVPKLPPGLFARVPASVPVIDTCNYYPLQRDGSILPIENGTPESAWVASTIGHPVIKVFNNIQWTALGSRGLPAGAPGRVALPVSGDDPAAKAIVMGLVEAIGFDAVDNGPLSNSWRQQPGTPAYIKNDDAATLRRQLAEASPVRSSAFSGTAQSPAA